MKPKPTTRDGGWTGPRGNRVFTLGREREKTAFMLPLAEGYDTRLMYAVIDAAHDLLEEVRPAAETLPIFQDGFENGPSGTWEATGSWVRKLQGIDPKLLQVWTHACTHPKATVRFRAAAFLMEMPQDCFWDCFLLLLNDRSAKVRTKAACEPYEHMTERIVQALRERKAIEADPNVLEAITFALGRATL